MCLHDRNYCVILLLEFITNRSHVIWYSRKHQVTIILCNITADIICVNTAGFKYKADLTEELYPGNPWGSDDRICLIYTLGDNDL